MWRLGGYGDVLEVKLAEDARLYVVRGRMKKTIDPSRCGEAPEFYAAAQFSLFFAYTPTCKRPQLVTHDTLAFFAMIFSVSEFVVSFCGTGI